MKYFQTKNGVTIDENRNIIPMDESNAIYQKYLDFLKADGTVEQTDLLSDFEIDLANKYLNASKLPVAAASIKARLAGDRPDETAGCWSWVLVLLFSCTSLVCEAC